MNKNFEPLNLNYFLSNCKGNFVINIKRNFIYKQSDLKGKQCKLPFAIGNAV